jgi:hypothetical protein
MSNQNDNIENNVILSAREIRQNKLITLAIETGNKTMQSALGIITAGDNIKNAKGLKNIVENIKSQSAGYIDQLEGVFDGMLTQPSEKVVELYSKMFKKASKGLFKRTSE